jgi:hypothetical protein
LIQLSCGVSIMKILECPINHNHIQARVDSFKDWLYQLNYEQLEAVTCDIEQYLLDEVVKIDDIGEDPSAAIQAAVRISEARWWIAHL